MAEMPRGKRKSIVISNIVNRADGMFLLANHHFEFVFAQLNNSQIMKALDDPPRSIDDTYALILERAEMNKNDERSYQLMIRILRWLAGASRPMN